MPLDPVIIEEIRRREEEKRRQEDERKREQPSIQIEEPPMEGEDPPQEPEKKDRGVIIINPDGSEERDEGRKAYGTVINFL